MATYIRAICAAVKRQRSANRRRWREAASFTCGSLPRQQAARDLILGAKPSAEPPVPSPSDKVSAGLTCAVADPPRGGLRPGGEVPRFRADKSGWQFWFGWMAGRLDGDNMKDGSTVGVSLNTPFVTWPIYCPTQVPSGQVIFQLGENQICILDPNEKKISLLAKGRSPVITMNDSMK